jgi:hypothetical protein
MRDPPGGLLRAALGFLSVEPREPELEMLHRWLDTWSGIGHVIAGMSRQGYDLELRRYNGQGWRATFYPAGFEHSRTTFHGSALMPTPWQARSGRRWRRCVGGTLASRRRVTGR